MPPRSAGRDPSSASELLPLVYEELRLLAEKRMAQEPGGAHGQTLQATALVHEAFLRLVENGSVHWNGRGHFFGAAALAMRRILVERARSRAQVKRGGAFVRVPLADLPASCDGADVDFIVLDDALTALEAEEPRYYGVVMLRYFAGLSIDDAAQTLEISPSTIKRDWDYARAWLYDRMSPEPA